MQYNLTDTLLKIERVSLRYGDKQILRDVNLEVKDIVVPGTIKGQVITLLGKSGIGKSQLMRIISGLIAPTTGGVLVGKDQKPVEHGEVGMVMQNYPLFAHRTVMGNLKVVSNNKVMIDEYLNTFEMTPHKDKYPRQLSGGQKQRIAVIQQLLCSEHFILFDEPYSGADLVQVEKITAMINKVANRSEENTVIISSHILEPAMAISDTVWVLGKEKDKEGSTVLYSEDLAAQGLAWQPDIRKDKRFIDKVDQIRNIFQTL